MIGETRSFGRHRRQRLVAAVAALTLALMLAALVLTAATLTSFDTSGTEPAASTAPDRPAPERNEDSGKPEPEEAKEPEPPEVAQMPTGGCRDLLALVNEESPLPPGYEPEDLVTVGGLGIPALDERQLLRREAAGQLSGLLAAAEAAEEELMVASAYRSYVEQWESYAYWTAYYGEGAGGMSAVPGTSEHQLGTAVDFTNSAAEYRLWWQFGDTTASAWLKRNAPDYGYVLSYPPGFEEETGYNWEPWHYRYVGVEAAVEISAAEGSPTAYLRQNGVIPEC